jgi:hypothetical protein
MQHSSEFPGPSQDDYANVLALNTAFIKANTELKGPQRGRLAAAPFLLFSLREDDTAWWADVLADQRQGDLMRAAEHESPELRRIQSAAISFLWQLAHRNPYAARVISGATISWCENITSLPLVTLLNRIGGRDDLMVSRLDRLVVLGERLLGNGTSSRLKVRRSSQITALQTLLTRPESDNHTQLSAAACSMSGPLRVLDKKL